MLCDNIEIKDNHLYFANYDVNSLAKQYGTPLYLLDEEKIRENCRVYQQAFKKYFGDHAKVLYASKANSFKRIYEIMKDENMGIDVVSIGEIYTAILADYDLSYAYFHGNNKTDYDIAYAIKNHIGYFVVDNIEELLAIEKEASKNNIIQKILIRLTPGIDPHTYKEVNTGMVDSKFGNAIETGQAEEITLLALQQKHLELVGFHAHIGSQVFGEDVFEKEALVMIKFISFMKNKYNYKTIELDLGGGFGVPYVDKDPIIDIDLKIKDISMALKKACLKYDVELPIIHMEPGRSIIANAGMTLYTVGSVKKIKGYKNYVSIDGGMCDNPRYALYKSSYTCLCANKMNEINDFKCSVVGRCCESGDIIQENVMLPSSIQRSDIIGVCTTGAYNYSMSSNYNRLTRPPIVMLNKNNSYLVVKRETLDDLIRNDI